MSADFPFVKGDKVRLPDWKPGVAVLITAVGEEQFLGKLGHQAWELLWTFSDTWERYIEPPTKPEWLVGAWCNVYPTHTYGFVNNAQSADATAEETRIGRISGTGEWVPCKGKQVLA